MGFREVRLALPQMAVGGLSENWLFKEIGDFHWELLAEHFGRPVTELTDPSGDRALPVFVRIRVSAGQPLSAFREGDRLRLAGELARVDDGAYVSDVECRSGGAVLTARLMTVFAKPAAAGALVPVRPAAPEGTAVPAADAGQAEFHREFMAARRADPARPLPDGDGGPGGGEPLFTHTYRLNPYYDLNGAGLLYFASYPHIHDHCERLHLRRALAAAGVAEGTAEWARAAATAERDVVYLGNCGPDDAVVFRLDAARAEGTRLRLTATLLRESDGAPLARVRTVKEVTDPAVAAALAGAALDRDTGTAAPAPAPRPAPEAPRAEDDADPAADAALAEALAPVMADALGVPRDRLDHGTDLRTLGLDSFSLTAFAQQAAERLEREVDPSRLFQAFTLADIARVVAGRPAPGTPPAAPRPAVEDAGDDAEAIAVIGMAGRFPGADSVAELWRVLAEGRETVGEVPADRWDTEAQRRLPDAPVQRGGFLRDIRRFDHAFFRISRREAELIDPQQRLFLEVAWEAFEDAGHDVTALRGSRTGVFVGVCHSDYAAVLRDRLTGTEPHRAVATSPSVVANRVSYAFGFHGASVAVDTMCSSSLVAVEQAVNALRSGGCEQALVGGVNVICDPGQHQAYARTGALSPDGRCKTFDESADGYARAEGVCALVLKPLSKARADGDRVHAVIKGVAVNHGGQAQSLTAPNADAQAELLKRAYRSAGIDPATVGYLEAHGTGTRLGDPIEVAGITAAFTELYRERDTPLPDGAGCALGSVKTNIGHLEAAAGLAGMIKVLLAMGHGVLPATRNVDRLNPMIRLDGTPLRVQRETAPWPRLTDASGRPLPRRAGVSSFGMGGTNAHVVLEEFTEEPAAWAGAADGPCVVPLSARDAGALRDAVRALLEFLADEPAPSLPEIAYTLQTGRAAMAERLAVVAGSVAGLRERLRAFLDGSAGEPADDGGLGEVARRWAAGGEVEWAALWPGRRPRPVSLPTYPFRRDRHWVGERGTGGGAREAFVVPRWRPSAVPQTAAPEPGAYLVLVNEASEAAADRLFAGVPGCRALVVRADRIPGGPEALETVLAAHGGLAAGERLAAVVDLADWWPAGAPAADTFRLRFPLLRQVLAGHRLPSLTVLRITRGTVPGEAAGLYRALPAELRTVRARTVEVDFGPDRADRLAAVAAAELAADDRRPRVRHRAGTREYAALDLLTAEETAAPGTATGGLDAIAAGTVVITGGTGEIGLALATELHRRGARHLLLLGRTRLPARARWAALAADPATEPRLRRRLAALARLDAAGASLEVRAHALSDAPSLRRLLTGAAERGGALTAVFHCAGAMADSRSLLAKPADEVRRVLDAKVRGVRTLWAALADQPPLDLVLFSSVSAAVPRLGASYADYAAANAYLDDFAAVHDTDGGHRVRSLQWPVWRDTGLGRDRGEAVAGLGIPELPVDGALRLLDDALRIGGHPVMLPCRIEPDAVDLAELSRSPLPPAAAPVPPRPRTEAPPAAVPDVGRITRVFARTLRTTADQLAADVSFADLGVDSLLMAELVRELEADLGRPVDPTLLQEHPTIGELAAELAPEGAASAPVAAPAAVPAAAPAVPGGPVPVAVIGMGCRFPGAASPDAFWRALVRGEDHVTEVPPDRWDAAALYSPVPQPGRSISKWGGFIEDAADFDPAYFGFDGETARHLDPLVRKALEVTAEALLDAGYRTEEVKGRRVGVYLGTRTANYREYLRPLPREAIVGLGQNFVAAHVSHHFDLTGPNLVVDSACSSSLVGVHLACQSLALGESEMALAGGVDLLLDEEPYLLLSQGKALSPTGRCRTFDEAADGFVPGEGAGVLVLKRLADAERDGDRILAVIESSAVNNDGRTMGYTTPSARAQRELIQRALDAARIDPRGIGYVETHGTGTMIGDPIELQALTAAYARHTAERGFCGVGSVKSNIGHLLSAAGVAGLMKVVLTLRHQQIPPTLHCARPNPRFAFPESPFRPVTELTDLTAGPALERAAVSSFGFGGTNAHLIVARGTAGTGSAASVRQPLPPPVYHRKRIWALPRPSLTDRPAGRSARLDLTFLPTG
ncbi:MULTISPECIES: beta-ketoacyl synthase N-terminal-like domain-containing protein [Streptomycetaceae]|uniref:Putative polyketide synthase n=1 Tax=Streptantibioticus cattleyicolor (strain ATCC 35852 / DSM 46488 / JCM 4925 / NBRC 14057 / NRRL 8057) TaxID=1003195 RepID=F8K3X6_STREN|nr:MULTISPECIES: beta-ketoacyl synthase N-terminal-like domain-containing protein [Streptomycetaceae]AEW95937.1 putative polyketide synthase [Streptantibioticus cattleyicolor NRRL 8057 = DSM 46488]MYS60473.1 KR domain-containing protein [Streptomyces sp. SID5468]CCB76272.1 putative polyketide synthase [Streptantibioticus cattleyicolor NRRL 8057 = DSM 46488]